MRRRTYSNKQKRHILDVISDRQSRGESLSTCCCDLQLQATQIRRWQNMRDKLAIPDASHRHSQHEGRSSMLDPLGEVLMRWFFELREQGFIVSVPLMTLKACELSVAFHTKGARAKDMIVRRFLARNKIVLRTITHECQRPPEAVREEALYFVRFALSKVIDINRCNEYVLNMDQTPFFSTCHLAKLLMLKG